MLRSLKNSFGYTARFWTTSMLSGGNAKKLGELKDFEGRILRIKFGQKHSGFIDDENQLYLWGDNDYGQLGVLNDKGIKIKKQDNPVLVSYFKDHQLKIVDFQLGRNHTMALDDQGRVFTWGKGCMTKYSLLKWLYPQTLALGHPENHDQYTPRPVKALKDTFITQIASGNDFASALSKEGEFFVWGRGEFGVLGFVNHSIQEPTINPLIKDLSEERLKSKIKKIESIQDFSSILFENGNLYNFGNNDYGQMGIGTTQSVDSCDVIRNPTQTIFEKDQPIPLSDFSLGEMQSSYLDKNGKVYFCG